jgi:hypothetical protein
MDYEDELNNRLDKRWQPSTSLKPLFDFRPTPTKYTWFKSVDEPIKSSEPLNDYPEYSSKIFNPGQRAPVEYYMKSVDVESKLRSQFMALQKSTQSVYIPELTSDIYSAPGATKLMDQLSTIHEIESRKPPGQLEPMTFCNMTRLNIKK